MKRVDSKIASERMAWSHSHGFCWACGATTNLHTHEIVRRSETAKALNLANYARLCQSCHEEAHGGYITKGVLLTLKLLFDGEHYNPEWVREHSIQHHHEALPMPQEIRLTIEHR